MMRWGVLAVGGLITVLLQPVEAVAVEPGAGWSWGGNDSGQLGTGTTTGRATAAAITGLTDVVELEAGRQHTIALRSDGTVWTWGFNEMGPVG